MKLPMTLYPNFLLLAVVGTTTMSLDSFSQSELIVREYCTEIGRFDLTFFEDEISGSYTLLPKKSLGAIWGQMEVFTMIGRWLDGDGTGDIIMTFSTDYSSFSTRYRSDDEPDKWYDNWNGYLRPNQDHQFTIDGKIYQCEDSKK